MTAFKYPRLTLLLVILIATFSLFKYESQLIHTNVSQLGMLGVFIGGFLYAFSFTAFTATGIFLNMPTTTSILILALLAGFGSLLGDLVILRFAKLSFEQEFNKLYKERFIKRATGVIPRPIQHFLKITLAMLIIASPLPDEAGVVLLANGYRLPKPIFSAISFTLNTMGIYLILYIASEF